jgi:hypothetical protein
MHFPDSLYSGSHRLRFCGFLVDRCRRFTSARGKRLCPHERGNVVSGLSKQCLSGGVQDLGQPVVEELLLDWLDPFMTVEGQDKMRVAPRREPLNKKECALI